MRKTKSKKQRWTHLHVIMGNPPYLAGKKKADESLVKQNHPNLENRISSTYREKDKNRKLIGSATGLFNSYIKAFRWASDRIGNAGVIGFVTPASFISSSSAAGMRACLEKEVYRCLFA